MKINDKLKKAIEKNDLAYIYKVCDKDFEDINAPINDKGDNLLLWAVENEDIFVLNHLLRNKNVDLNYVNKNNDSIVNKIVKKLFSGNRYIGNEKPELYTALKRILARSNIDVNIQDSNGRTPWMNIVEFEASSEDAQRFGYDYSEIEDLFFNRKDLKINLIDNFGYSALHTSLYLQNNKISNILLEKPELNYNNEQSNALAPLMIAIHRADVVNFKKLLAKKNINVNVQSQGYNPLIQILYMIDSERKYADKQTLDNYVEIANLLIDRKDIDLNALVLEDSAIHIAYKLHSEGGYGFLDKMFRKLDLNLNITDENGDNILMKAIEDGDIKLVSKILAREGLDINAQNNNGETVLTKAIKVAKSDDKVYGKILDKVLVYPGLDINMWEEENKRRGLSNAIATEKEEVVDRLLESENLSFEDPNSLLDLDEAISRLDYSLIRKLAENKNFSPETKDMLYSNVLSHIFDYSTFVLSDEEILAIESIVLDNCNEENIKVLLNETNNLGNNALMSAIQLGVSGELIQGFLDEVVKRFGYVDIDFDIVNNFGDTIYSLAKSGTAEKNKGDVIRVLDKYKKNCKANTVVQETEEDENVNE